MTNIIESARNWAKAREHVFNLYTFYSPDTKVKEIASRLIVCYYQTLTEDK